MISALTRIAFVTVLFLGVLSANKSHAQPMCAADNLTVDPTQTKHTEKLDIIWVIDNSPSMKDYQGALWNNMPVWLNSLLDMKIDFQIAVLNSNGNLVSDLKGEHALSAQTLLENQDQFFRDFKKAIRVGTEGSRGEQHVRTLLDFMKQNAKTFLREKSNLAVLFLSDLDSVDASNIATKNFTTKMLKYRSAEHLQLFGLFESHNRETFDELNERGVLPIEMYDLDPSEKKIFRNPDAEMAENLKSIIKKMGAFSPVEIEIPLTLVPTDPTVFEFSIDGEVIEPLKPFVYDAKKKTVSAVFRLDDITSIKVRYSANCIPSMCAADTIAFNPPPPKKLDIIWVIDNSGSMDPYQRALSKNLEAWVKDVVDLNVDFQIVVVTTDFLVYGQGQLDTNHYLQNRRQFFRDFEDAVLVGTHGSGTEMDFDPVLTFLKGHSSWFLREGSDLVTIFVTDEDDYSSTPATQFARTLLNYRNPKNIQLFGILNASDRSRFDDLARSGVLPIKTFNLDTRANQDNSSSMATQLGVIGKGLAKTEPITIEIPLTAVPFEQIFELYVDGEKTESLTPLQYDPVTNKVTISLIAPKPMAIQIRYPGNCDFAEKTAE